MNTKQQYLVSKRGLQSQPLLLASLTFDHSPEPVEAQLKDLPQIMKADPKLRASMPRRVKVNGAKGGVFPCLMAKTEVAAAYLSTKVGYKVPTGDGVAFATQAAAGVVAIALRELGANLEELTLEWRVGSSVAPLTKEEVQIPLSLIRPIEGVSPIEAEDAPWS